MKKAKNPILVILSILFLSLFIILPPLFRTYMKENDMVTKPPVKDKIQILKCYKYFKEEFYRVSSSVRYKNDLIDSNTIIYEKVEQVPDDVLDNQSITVNEEYALFKSLNNVDISTEGTATIIKIDQSLIDNNLDNSHLPNYYQPLEEQRLFYESMGYTCNELDS